MAENVDCRVMNFRQTQKSQLNSSMFRLNGDCELLCENMLIFFANQLLILATTTSVTTGTYHTAPGFIGQSSTDYTFGKVEKLLIGLTGVELLE